MNLELLADLHNVFLTADDKDYRAELLGALPQLLVIGSQSVGKTTLLERIINIPDVLPKGSGFMVTRCPVLLQLEYTPGVHFEADVWLPQHAADGQENVNIKPTSFNEPQQVSKCLQDYMEGIEEWLSWVPIKARIRSESTCCLTLLDTPGLIRVVTEEQPAHLAESIRKLVKRLAMNPNAVIVAVSSATNDLANSDSLHLAKEVDPEGFRTLSVITKYDLLQNGSKERQAINESISKYPLKLGCVCVSNLDTSIGLTQLLSKLEQILEILLIDFARSRYKHYAQERHEVQEKLADIGESVDSSPSSKSALLLSLVTSYCRAVEDLLNGRSDYSESTELMGGARLSFVYQDWFAGAVMDLEPFPGNDQEISTAIRNACGSTTVLFVPENAFEILVRKQIAKLQTPIVHCVEEAQRELLAIYKQPLETAPEWRKYPALTAAISDIASTIVNENSVACDKQCKQLVQVEMAYINKVHPDFVKQKQLIHGRMFQQHQLPGSAKTDPPIPPPTYRSSGPSSPSYENSAPPLLTPQVYNDVPSTFMSFWRRGPPLRHVSSGGQPKKMICPSKREHDTVLVEIVRLLIRSYFDIVKKSFADLIPKFIMHYLVNQTITKIQQVLITELYKDNIIESLLAEGVEVVKTRQVLLSRQKTLNGACEILRKLCRS